MSDIFEEIDDDLKQDKVFQVWKKYSKPIIAVIAIVVLALGAYLVWSNIKASQARAASDSYATALEAREDGDLDAAADQFGELISNGGFYGTLASFQLADLEAGRGNSDAAVSALDKVENSGVAGRYKELATLMSAVYQLDSADAATLTAKLEGLTGGDASFANSARELLALVSLREGDSDQARTQLEVLIDDESVSNTIKARAREYLQTLPATD